MLIDPKVVRSSPIIQVCESGSSHNRDLWIETGGANSALNQALLELSQITPQPRIEYLELVVRRDEHFIHFPGRRNLTFGIIVDYRGQLSSNPLGGNESPQ